MRVDIFTSEEFHRMGYGSIYRDIMRTLISGIVCNEKIALNCFEEHLNNPNALFITLFNDDTPIGFAILFDHPDHRSIYEWQVSSKYPQIDGYRLMYTFFQSKFDQNKDTYSIIKKSNTARLQLLKTVIPHIKESNLKYSDEHPEKTSELGYIGLIY